MEAAVAIVLLLGLFSHLSEPSKYESKVERVVRSIFPDAKAIQVKVKGRGGLATLEGKFDSVEILIAGAKAKSDALLELISQDEASQKCNSHTGNASMSTQLRKKRIGHIGVVITTLQDCELDGMPIAKLSIELTDARYDFNKLLKEQRISLIDVSGGHFLLRMPISFICSLIEEMMRANGFIDPIAKLHNSWISIEAYYSVLQMRIPISIEGEFNISPPSGIAFELKRIKALSVVPLPSFIMERLIGNRIISFELPKLKTPFEPQISSVHSFKDEIEFRGILRLSKGGQAPQVKNITR